MIALAVVGLIASGKTTVLRLLEELGARTCSADDLGRELTAAGQPALNQIVAEFGEEYLRGNGTLDRRRLAELIFRSASARERLEEILHPAILRRIEAWLTSLRGGSDPPPVAAVEVLRLPRHLRAREPFDGVWLCAASEETRLRRLIERDAMPEVEAQLRIEAQRGQQVEDCDPDLVLNTEGSAEQLASRVRDAWANLPFGP